MAYVSSVTIHVDSSSRIFKHRDDIQGKFGVKFNPYFKDRQTNEYSGNTRKGAYVDMKISGSTSGVSQAKKALESVLAEWQVGYDTFCENRSRQKKAIRARRGVPSDHKVAWPSIQDTDSVDTNTNKSNPFQALLDLDNESDVAEQETEKTKILKGWNKIVAKNETRTNFSWGDDCLDD